ncbi:helix-turn-helix domain-containing protein [Lentzea sp. NPDC102401]|uniref:helix-turn-helix domain-containing protein n=1 Tax=Lentzea sp. NPDC102401 TaxID=3364128 RepID=UPI00381822E1
MFTQDASIAVVGGRCDSGGPKRSMLSRALAILCVFGPADATLTLTELSQRAGLSKPTAHRLVAELVQWGLLERSGRDLRLGARCSVLGSRVVRHRVLRDAAVPLLVRTSGLTGGSAHLFIREGRGVVQLDRFGEQSAGDAVPGEERSRERIAAHAAMSAVSAFDHPARTAGVTAQLDAERIRRIRTIRSLGYAAVEHGQEPGRVLAVACPVLIPGAGAVAALAVAGTAPGCEVGRVAPVLLASAGSLGRSLSETTDLEWAS